jgi:hypothetical protein
MSKATFGPDGFGGSGDQQKERRKVTILLAEDEPSLRQMLRVILETAGYDLISLA